MSINNLISQLDQRVKVMRHYSNEEDWSLPSDDLPRYADHLSKSRHFLGHYPLIGENTYKTSDMCLLGPGFQKDLADEWNLPLPADYLAFCSRFDDYLFAGSAFIIIHSAADVKESVTAAREAASIDLSSQHRLFHFAGIIGIPGYYAFRWSCDFSHMDVVFIWDCGDVSEATLLGKEGARFTSDLDFTSWLARIIETDGSPLFPAGRWPMADGGWCEDNAPYFKRVP